LCIAQKNVALHKKLSICELSKRKILPKRFQKYVKDHKMTKKTMDSSETFEKSQEFVTNHIANSEKVVESMIEFNAAVFKGGEAMAKRMYENYVSNVAAAFDGVKALNKTNDVAEFYKVATSNVASAAERYTEQNKNVAELSGKVMRETGEAGRLAFSKGFSLSM
jgi:hypothetical protein